MERRLLVMRHGDAEWPQAGGSDFERKLSDAGREEAKKTTKWLLEESISPQEALVSSSLRTRQTVSVMLKTFTEMRVQYQDELYRAEVGDVLKAINELNDEADCVILVAHNPTVTILCEYLSGYSIGGMSTGSCVELIFEMDSWAWASRGIARLGRIFHPSK